MKNYPLLIGLLGAWSYGMMAPSLSDTNMGKRAAAKNTVQYEQDVSSVERTKQTKKQTPKYKLVQRVK